MFAEKVDTPARMPAKCKGCGAGSLTERKWWIDTGTIEEFYGRVYYCNICFTEFVNLVGYYSPEQVAELEQDNRNVRQELKELRDGVDALGTLGIDLGAIRRFVQDHYVSTGGAEDRLDELIERAANAGQQALGERSDDIPDSKPGRKRSVGL